MNERHSSGTFMGFACEDHSMDQDEHDVFAGMNKVMTTILDASEDQVQTPLTMEIEFTGTKTEAMGSARHVADMIEEADGEIEYFTDTSHVTEVDPIPGTDERHKMRIMVSE